MEALFRYVNLFPMPVWLAMMFAPRQRFTERVARSSSLFCLAVVNYLLALIIGVRSSTAEDQGLPDFTSLDGISRSLGTREGALGAWSHMLALDLFTGTWIYRQCRRLDAPAWVRMPALFFTLMTGPLGLMVFLLWRSVDAGKGEALSRVPPF